MPSLVTRWYQRNFYAVLGALGVALGGGAWLLDLGLVKFASTVKFTYGGVLLTLLLGGAGLAALGVWLAHRRRTPRLKSLGLAAVLLGLVAAFGVYRDQYQAYDRQALAFESAGVGFSGTLYTPPGPGPHPAVVMVHGSLPFDRNFYFFWSDPIVRAGIAVYVYDKRGTGRSGGVFVADNNGSEENLSLLADDAVAALNALAGHPAIDPARIGLWGISQAGWIVPMATLRFPTLAFAVLVSGPTTSVGQEGLYSRLMGDDIEAAVVSRAEAEAQVRQAGPSGFDPRPDLAQMTVPTLWIYGGKDNSIPVQNSMRILDTLKQDNKPFTYVLFPEGDHVLLERPGLLPDVPEAFWTAMLTWMRRQAGLAEG